MNHSDCKIHYASKQKRIIALQNNRQKPAKQVQKTWLMRYLMHSMIWRASRRAFLCVQSKQISK